MSEHDEAIRRGDPTCGCCEGIVERPPAVTANRPGLTALPYRVGTHESFLATLLARLSSLGIEVTPPAGGEAREVRPLGGLTTRSPDDPAIALLDAWATVADVLTFYQERIANEGYLRTARERRSLVELARLVGYRPRPGVSASVYLAFDVDDKYDEVVVPAGTRAQSVPEGEDETAQFFETREALTARAEWNALRPRQTEPQVLTALDQEVSPRIYLQGTATRLKTNDLLYVPQVGIADSRLYRVWEATPDPDSDRTEVELRPWRTDSEPTLAPEVPTEGSVPLLGRSIENLTAAGTLESFGVSEPAASRPERLMKRWELKPRIDKVFRRGADTRLSTAARFLPEAYRRKYLAAARKKAAEPPAAEPPAGRSVDVFRCRATLFGANAPLKHDARGNLDPWPLEDEEKNQGRLYLNALFDQIRPGTRIVVDYGPDSDPRLLVTTVRAVGTVARVAYNLAATVTWLDPETALATRDEAEGLSALRNITVWAQSEELRLAEAPRADCFPEASSPGESLEAGAAGAVPEGIELDGFCPGLEAGRLVIVTGERSDLGIVDAELAMIAGVYHSPADEPDHTFVEFATELAYTYKRDTVTLYANVAEATHGESRSEVLGSGDGRRAGQSLPLSFEPLTHLAAATPEGAESTLEVRVDGVRWHEAPSPADLGPEDRLYLTRGGDEDTVTVVFGDGLRGARLPSGVENVTASYRQGTGKAGNVKAGQISQLATRPLGVKGVVHPLAASGGADRDSAEAIRRNAPTGVTALDRLVSVEDYADFARGFAGIAKASARRFVHGRQKLVHLTVAGTGDVPIEPYSDLYRNLLRALGRAGDPRQPVLLATRKLLLVVISARVRVHPDHLWQTVEPKVRAALVENLGFERRELGQDVTLSEVIATIQSVPGVVWVDVDTLGVAAEDDEVNELVIDLNLENRIVAKLAEEEGGAVLPAQLAYLDPDLPQTLLLQEISS